ncbi:sensor histidine kinase [Salisediminibacterium halotolerans]|uniref:histidine kinase n=1 Tax=Salisediminibacterium halotolerans TaxID=517425 RepID=A0A1H9TUJ9_9BACI|nr:ATP-binding protein [Salisediminibacterium haloalkalitolerans]SES00668.1 two-component system, NtrC family, sensor histidine kinase AtoS [Salisediminibacterium haloalkalitolerans]
MKLLLQQMTFRSKILIIFLALTVLLMTFSVFLIRGIDQMNQTGNQIAEEDVPELIWVYHYEEQLNVREYMVSHAKDNFFCCDFADTYENYIDQSADDLRDNMPEKPETIETIEHQIEALDFLILNHIRGLIRFSGPTAAETFVEEEYNPQLEEINRDLQAYQERLTRSMSTYSEDLSAIVTQSVIALLVLTAVAICIAFSVSYRLSASLTQPIEEMEEKLASIARGHYGETLEENDQIELSSLTRSINEMSLTLQESFQQIVHDKKYREQILDSLPVGVITYNQRDNDFTLNTAASNYLKQDEQTVKEQILCKKGHDQDNTAFWQKISSEELFSNEKILFQKDGETRSLLVSKAALSDHDSVFGYIYYFVDITETDELEQKMKQTEKLAAVGALAAGAAHEIRNPLAVIDGFISLIDQTLPDEEKSEFHLPLLHKELARIDAIIEEMLMLAKPSSPKISDVNIQDIVAEIMPLITKSEIFRGVAFKVDVDTVGVQTDAEQLKQVIYNLLVNAGEALEGAGTVRIYSDVSPAVYQLFICDDGPGIPEDIRKNLFHPFETSKASGTGLGLPIAQRILQNQGGDLRLYETSAEGTCFVLELPLKSSA